MDANNVFPSKYLKASDIGESRPVLTIRSIEIMKLQQDEDSEADSKPALFFEGKEKALLCNKTNWNTLIGLFGSDTDAWIGQRIKIGVADVAFKGKMTQAIRISTQRVSAPTPAPVAVTPIAAALAPVGSKPTLADDDIPF